MKLRSNNHSLVENMFPVHFLIRVKDVANLQLVVALVDCVSLHVALKWTKEILQMCGCLILPSPDGGY